MSTTLVTGASGFAASHVIDRLDRNDRIVGWRRSGGGGAPERHPHVEWQAVDVLDAASVTASFAEIEPDVVYHLAGAPQVDTSWRNVSPHLATNAVGTHHLLEALRHSRRPCRVLVVTSAQVYQSADDPITEDAPLVPPSPYGFSKLAQDQLALQAAHDDELDVVLARPFNHTGPRQDPVFAVPSFARQVARIEAGLASATIRVGNLDSRRDLTDVRDVAAAYIRIVADGRAGRPYNVCSGRAWRIGDLLEELIHLARVPIAVEVDPERLRPNDVPVLQGSATRLRTELGWSPEITIEQTVRDTLEYWREETAAGR